MNGETRLTVLHAAMPSVYSDECLGLTDTSVAPPFDIQIVYTVMIASSACRQGIQVFMIYKNLAGSKNYSSLL